jgi:superfamily II DNA helicase RecQ
MVTLVSYFGDTADSRRPCGICDFCSPASAVAQTFRPPTKAESAASAKILEALKGNDGLSAGRLHAQTFPNSTLDRRNFEELLNAMARGGLVAVTETSFEKDGKRIDFRKVRITEAGRDSEAAGRVVMPGAPALAGGAPRERPSRKRALKRAKARRGGGALENALREWRVAEASKSGLPAFRILTDKALLEIAAARPASKSDLQSIAGVSAAVVRKYGDRIVGLVSKAGS